MSFSQRIRTSGALLANRITERKSNAPVTKKSDLTACCTPATQWVTETQPSPWMDSHGGVKRVCLPPPRGLCHLFSPRSHGLDMTFMCTCVRTKHAHSWAYNQCFSPPSSLAFREVGQRLPGVCDWYGQIWCFPDQSVSLPRCPGCAFLQRAQSSSEAQDSPQLRC